MKLILFIACFTFPFISISKEQNINVDKLKDIIERRCIKCHGAKNSKGVKTLKAELDLEGIFDTSANQFSIIKKSFQLVLANKMPPEDSKPLGRLKSEVLKGLSNYIEDHGTKSQLKSEKLFRRSIKEITLKIESLLKINLSFSNPLKEIPDNLKINRKESAPLIDQYFLGEYLSAIDQIVDKAFTLQVSKENEIDWSFSSPLFYSDRKLSTSKTTNGIAENIIWYGPHYVLNGTVAVESLHKTGVPHSGYYDIEVTATAQNRGKLNDDLTYIDSSAPLRLGVKTGLSRKGGKTNKPVWFEEANEANLAEFDLPDNTFKTFKTRVWLEKYYYPRLTYRNGSIFGNRLVNRLRQDERKRLPINLHAKFISESLAPRILVKSVKISSVPQRINNFLMVFGPNYSNENHFEKSIINFAEKAYDSRLTLDEKVALLENISNFKIQNKCSLKDTYKYAVKYILTSSKILFGKYPQSEIELIDHINARLTGLLGLKTKDPQILHSIIEQNDLDFFSKNFLDYWLHIHKSKTVIPSIHDKYYKKYFINNIKEYSLKETYLTFQYMLKKNKSALDLLNSNYKIINEPLAKHYGITFDNKDDIKELGQDSLYLYPGKANSVKYYLVNQQGIGGLISQASILNLTSDEVATNPILRGSWIMKELLGIPLRHPPKDVPSFEPDLRSAKTVKEQLEAHKTIKSCASCHTDMDPLGLVLELYDNIGQYRSTYRNNKIVEPEVELFGEAIDNIKDYKKIIRETKGDIFVLNLSSKILEYFLKREITDDEYIELYKKVKTLKVKEYPLLDLLKYITQHSSLSNFKTEN